MPYEVFSPKSPGREGKQDRGENQGKRESRIGRKT
jgi:hypothetical protein